MKPSTIFPTPTRASLNEVLRYDTEQALREFDETNEGGLARIRAMMLEHGCSAEEIESQIAVTAREYAQRREVARRRLLKFLQPDGEMAH